MGKIWRSKAVGWVVSALWVGLLFVLVNADDLENSLFCAPWRLISLCAPH